MVLCIEELSWMGLARVPDAVAVRWWPWLEASENFFAHMPGAWAG